MPTKLPYVVECKSTYPFWETIAAFNVDVAAEAYAATCYACHQEWQYRVRKGAKILFLFEAKGVPWCDYCRCWHGPQADHIVKISPKVSA